MPDGKSRKAKVLSSRTVFKGKLFSLRTDQVIEPGDVRATRDILEHHGSVVILPVFEDASILLARQFRYAAGDFLWELVAGHVDRGERPADAAPRELAEEAGYTARRWKKILEFFPSPGVSTERMWVFLATGLKRGEAHPEEDERIEVRRFSLGMLDTMMRGGKIRDAKTITSILYYQRFLR